MQSHTVYNAIILANAIRNIFAIMKAKLSTELYIIHVIQNANYEQ